MPNEKTNRLDKTQGVQTQRLQPDSHDYSLISDVPDWLEGILLEQGIDEVQPRNITGNMSTMEYLSLSPEDRKRRDAHMRRFLSSTIKGGNVMQGCVFIVIWLAVLAVVEFVIATGFMWLWNALMPALFHLSTIDFWQALGLWILLSLVGGAFRGATAKK